MDSLLKISYDDHDKLIEYLSSRYNESDLLSILRKLNMKKERHYNKLLTIYENCENIVEAILQQELLEKLLLLLQTDKFYRKSFSGEFPHLKYMINKDFFGESSEAIFNITSSTKDDLPIEKWIELCKSKMVLILGKDSPDEYLKELELIANIVKEKGYEPILIKKQPEINSDVNEQKMLAYASLARFVIIEKSYPAGQIDEAKICTFNRIPSIWINKLGQGDTWMQGDYEVDFKFIKTFNYEKNTVNECIEEGIAWIEKYIEEKTNTLNDLYPWR